MYVVNFARQNGVNYTARTLARRRLNNCKPQTGCTHLRYNRCIQIMVNPTRKLLEAFIRGFRVGCTSHRTISVFFTPENRHPVLFTHILLADRNIRDSPRKPLLSDNTTRTFTIVFTLPSQCLRRSFEIIIRHVFSSPVDLSYSTTQFSYSLAVP